MLPTAMCDPVLSVMQQIAQWNNREQSWSILQPMLSSASADLKGIPLLEASEQLRWALSDINMKSNTVGISTNFPSTMRVEGIEYIGKVGDGKCRRIDIHQAIAEQKRELTAEYSIFWLCKQMNNREVTKITDCNGNDHRGKIISVARKNDHNYFWVVKISLENVPETSVECVVQAG